MNKDELKKKLNPKDVKSRKKGGTNLSYIEGWKTIDEANAIFDFDGWSRETVYNREVTRVDVEVGKDPYKAPGFKVGYESKVTITVGGVTRDGTGHGSQTSKDLFDAIEGAAKEAETDAMKRALMTFGNRFGLALYDKTQANVGVDEPEPNPRIEELYNKLTNDMLDIKDGEAFKEWWINGSTPERNELRGLSLEKNNALIKAKKIQVQKFVVQSPSQAAGND